MAAEVLLTADDEGRVRRIVETICDLRTHPLTQAQLSILDEGEQALLDSAFKARMEVMLKALLMVRATADWMMASGKVRQEQRDDFLELTNEAVREAVDVYDYDDLRFRAIFDLFDLGELRRGEFKRASAEMTPEEITAWLEGPGGRYEQALWEPMFEIQCEALATLHDIAS